MAQENTPKNTVYIQLSDRVAKKSKSIAVHNIQIEELHARLQAYVDLMGKSKGPITLSAEEKNNETKA